MQEIGRSMFGRFLKDDRGATAIEYGLIVAVLTLGIIAGVGSTSNALQDLWGQNNTTLHNALNPPSD